MFDLFSNLIGKSKKSNGKSSNEKDEFQSPKSDKSANNLYPTILLTDQMLKGDSGASSFEIINNESTTSSATNRTPFKTNDSVIVSSNNRQKQFSPLDNIPFSINTTNSTGIDNNLNDLNDCFTFINSVASYLANPSSEYKFTMEKIMITNHFESNEIFS